LSQKIVQSTDAGKSDLGENLALVLQRHGAKWFRFVLRVLGNEADAEDVLQEAVRRVLLRNRALATEDQVKKYLGRAIANTAIELYYSRKKDRTRYVAFQDNFGIYSTTPQTVLEEGEICAEREFMMQALNAALNRLPPKQYEAVRMTILEPGITSIRDAGALNGIAYSTLRHRSVQGLLRLRKFVRQALRGVSVKVLLC
jgi:RNA polymerase sigma factor (sigma-70 family)